MSSKRPLYLPLALALVAALLIGSFSVPSVQPHSGEETDTGTGNSSYGVGQTDRSTASNFGALVWTFECRNNGINLVDDWLFRRPLVIGADDTIIFEDGGSLYAIRNETLSWQYHVTDEWSIIMRTMSPPCVGPGGNIYVGGHDKFLHALDKDGNLLWKYDAGHFIDSTPAVGPDGTIYLGTTVNGWDENESRTYYLHAVNPDGTLKWKLETGPCSESAIVISPDETIFMVTGCSQDGWDERSRYLHSIDQNGVENWVRPLGNMSFQSPAVSKDGTIYLLTADDLNTIDHPERPRESLLMAVTPDGNLAWQLDVHSVGPYYSGVHGTPPVVADDGTIYFGICDGIAAVDRDGAVKWNYTIDRGLASTPVISKEGTVFFGSIGHYGSDLGNQGYLFALNPDGSLKWRTKIFDYPTSDVAIGQDGTVYVAASGNVFALNGGVSSEAMMVLNIAVVTVMVFTSIIVAFVLIKKVRKRQGRSNL